MIREPLERSEPVPGVRLVTERMPHVRSVSLGLWVGVGSRDETAELSGAAHLLEHLLFKGTPRRSARDIAECFDAIGGDLNAYSTKEYTCYYARVLDDDLPTASDVLTDMFRHALLEPDDVEAERRVVLEEIGMSYDMPDDYVHDLFGEITWPGHPLARPITGTRETVSAMRRDELAAFYAESYVPGGLVVTAAGNLVHADLARLLSAQLAGGQAAGPRPATRPPVATRRTAYQTRPTEQVHIVWGGQGLRRDDPDRYALSVMSTLYGGSMSSRLFQEVREKRGLVYSIYSFQHSYTECGLFGIYAGTQEASAPEVMKIVREEAAALAGGEVTSEEIARAKGHVRGGIVLALDDPGGRMSRLGKAELLHDDVLDTDEVIARVDAVTADEVTRVARRLFAESEQALACVGPVADGGLDRFVEPL